MRGKEPIWSSFKPEYLKKQPWLLCSPIPTHPLSVSSNFRFAKFLYRRRLLESALASLLAEGLVFILTIPAGEPKPIFGFCSLWLQRKMCLKREEKYKFFLSFRFFFGTLTQMGLIDLLT